jgi:mannose PTS system EIIA component
MPIVLARIDDRLIHGQVTEGWGKSLRPDVILVISDTVACSEWEKEICISPLPPSIRGEVAKVSDAAPVINRYARGPEKAYVLFESPADVFRVLRDGAELPVINVGGMHSMTGKRRILDYIYVNDADTNYLRALVESGVTLDVRDLPEHDRIDVLERL